MAGASPKRQFLDAITIHYLIAASSPDKGACKSNEYACWPCDVGSVDATQHLVSQGFTIITTTRVCSHQPLAVADAAFAGHQMAKRTACKAAIAKATPLRA